MLVHICCSVDSHYFLEELRREFSNEKLIGFFYDPNIHPYGEYLLRLQDVKRSCEILNIDLIEGIYNYEAWLDKVRGLEDEPEKGERCTACFDDRLNETVQKAIELDEKSFTTSLLISPLKSQEKLKKIGNDLAQKHNLNFIFRDYRSGKGAEKQNQAVKINKLYRQDYCGCIFALSKQRESQNKLIDETFSPITNQILPSSIEEKLIFYKNIDSSKIIIKESFLNYRLLSGKVSINNITVPSRIIFYSHSERNNISGKIDYLIDEVAYLNRENIKIISLQKLNELLNKSFKNIFEIDISIEDELFIRKFIEKSDFSLSIILIIDSLNNNINCKFDIEIYSKIYFDNREKLLKN